LVPFIAAELSRLAEINRSVLGEFEKLSAAQKIDHEKLERLSAWAALVSFGIV
jgi:hypothetical protein